MKGRKFSMEVRIKMSKSHFNHRISNETKVKIGNSHRGKKLSEVQRNKTSTT